MKLFVNDRKTTVAAATLAGLLEELGFQGKRVATALNGDFVAASARAATPLRDGDRIEIVAPRQGG